MRQIKGEELNDLQSSGKNILVDYKAKWCMPCKQLIPRLESIETEYHDVEFVMIDVDENQEHCLEKGIRSVPTVIFYKNGSEFNRSSGANSTAFYKEILNSL